MMTYTEINKQVNDKYLSTDEKAVLQEFIVFCTDKIKGQFPGQDTIHVPKVIIEDVFRNKKIPMKRQIIIMYWLEQDANESGWTMTTDEDYLLLRQKK